MKFSVLQLLWGNNREQSDHRQIIPRSSYFGCSTLPISFIRVHLFDQIFAGLTSGPKVKKSKITLIVLKFTRFMPSRRHIWFSNVSIIKHTKRAAVVGVLFKISFWHSCQSSSTICSKLVIFLASMRHIVTEFNTYEGASRLQLSCNKVWRVHMCCNLTIRPSQII